MRIGKLPESVLIRSVLKQVKHRREEVVLGPKVGQECAALETAMEEVLVLSADPMTGTVKDLGRHTIHMAANNLAAAGAEPIGVMLTILLPGTVNEEELRRIVKDAEAACDSLQMEILGVHTEVTRAVKQSLITVTGVGKTRKECLKTVDMIRPNQDIVVTKWIGLEGTSILANEKEEELRKRFPVPIVDAAKEFSEYMSVIPEARIGMEHGVTAMHAVREGGVFGALWEMIHTAGVGMEVEIKKIPIRQETVEVCEFFHVNPYLIMSGGSMMMVTDDGHELVRKLEQAGIHGTVIGRTTDSNDKILRNGEEVRYLDRPQQDELYKVLG